MKFLSEDSCDCADSGCPEHKGSDRCTNGADSRVFRVDMDDESGTAMCSHCAGDALDSGVFTVDSD